VTILLGVGAGVATVLQAVVTSRVVSQVFLAQASLPQVLQPLAMLLVFSLLRAVLVWGGDVSAGALARRLKLDLRRRLLQHLFDLGPAAASQERRGEQVAAASQGIEALDAYYAQYLPQLALATLVPLTCLLFVFPIDPLSGLVLLLTAPLIPVFMILIGDRAQAATRSQWRTLSRLNAYFLDVLQGLSTLKMLGRGKAQAQVIGDASERFRLATMSVLRITFLSALALEMIATLSTAVVAVEVGLRLLYGRLSFEQAFLVLLLAPEFYLPLRLLGTRFHAGMAGVAAAGQIFSILEQTVPRSSAASHASSSTSAANLPATTQDVAGQAGSTEIPAIQFEDVHYIYPDGRSALDGVSFTIAHGETVALVGRSGSGKSTLASLLLGFIAPSGGEIRAGSKTLASISLDEWREHLAWVPQKPYLFNATVLDNIRLARPQASLAEVQRAAELAHADQFIRRLPQGYATSIGEGGSRLSGGQAQRLALARAFLQDTSLVILDEATANLDPATEALVTESLARLLQGRTALVIAHRLSTVARLDRILVLDEGRIVQQGSHGELAQAPGLYRNLLGAWASLPEGPQVTIPTQPETSLVSKPLPASADLPYEAALAPSHTSWQAFRRLLSLAAPIKGWIALSALIGMATVFSGIGLMGASAYIISAAALKPSIADLQVAIVAVRFFGIARGLFRYLERTTSHQATFRLLARLRLWFYTALEPLAPARLLRYRSGDLLARMQQDIESLENFYVRALAPPLVAAGIALGMAFFLWRFDPRLALGVLLLQAIAGLGLPLLVRRLSAAPGRELVLQRAALDAALVDAVQGMPDLLAAGQRDAYLARLDASGQSLVGAQRRLAALNALQNASLGLLASLALWLVLLLAIPLVSSGAIPGVYLAVLALVALTSFEAFAPLPLTAASLESNLQAARRLVEIVDAYPEVIDAPDPLSLKLPALAPEIGETAAPLLEVRGLRFRYPSSWGFPASASLSEADVQIARNPEFEVALDGLDFSLRPGEALAIVGPSGAGKSTLVSLLLRFWEYRQGEILFDGVDLRRYTQEDLRRAIGVVAQTTYLFSASVRENLLLARPGASQEEVVKAARSAQIQERIESLPQGYETWIGEQGVRLSAGECQRLAIARALLKEAPLLVLDEPTANLDALTEHQLLEALQGLMAGRAILLLTHRLVGLEGMREILVMDRGSVVERGRHAELIRAGGLYQRMWYLQNQVLSEYTLPLRESLSPPP
jgi:ATP-binding cassette subfamily C protein CydCD